MYERMLDKQEVPSYENMYSYCGRTSRLFRTLNSFLLDNFNTTQEIRFPYGKEYGGCIT